MAKRKIKTNLSPAAAVKAGAAKAIGYKGKNKQFAYEHEGKVKVSYNGSPAQPVMMAQSRPKPEIIISRHTGKITHR